MPSTSTRAQRFDPIGLSIMIDCIIYNNYPQYYLITLTLCIKVNINCTAPYISQNAAILKILCFNVDLIIHSGGFTLNSRFRPAYYSCDSVVPLPFVCAPQSYRNQGVYGKGNVTIFTVAPLNPLTSKAMFKLLLIIM